MPTSKLYVKKSIKIYAPASRVWDVLTKPEYTGVWAADFIGGIPLHIESNWKIGSSVYWKDRHNNVLVEGTVTAFQMGKLLHFSAFDARGAQKQPLTDEDGITYALSEENGKTMLHIVQGGFPITTYGRKIQRLSDFAWDRVLPKVKKMAEKPETERFAQFRELGFKLIRHPAFQDGLFTLGYAMIGFGAIGDIYAGFNILNHGIWPGILLHLEAASSWLVGMMLAYDREANRASNPGTRRVKLGLILFPGVGIFGWVLAVGMAGLAPAPKKPSPPPEEEKLPVGPLSNPPGSIRLSEPAQPLANVLEVPDSKTKRTGLELAGRQLSPQAETFSNAFRAGPDPAVRALAAGPASQTGPDAARQARLKTRPVESEPLYAELHAWRGRLYDQWAGIDETTSPNHGFYLDQARKAFERAISIEPHNCEYQAKLAEILWKLSDDQSAWDLTINRLVLPVKEHFHSGD